MSGQYDVKKEWEKTRAQLAKFSKEALVLAKKGEKELVNFSRKSKLQLDTATINLKKERLYYLIGKEYVRSRKSKDSGIKLTKLMSELNSANKEQVLLKRKIKTNESPE